jgi:hypothetical protein
MDEQAGNKKTRIAAGLSKETYLGLSSLAFCWPVVTGFGSVSFR